MHFLLESLALGGCVRTFLHRGCKGPLRRTRLVSFPASEKTEIRVLCISGEFAPWWSFG